MTTAPYMASHFASLEGELRKLQNDESRKPDHQRALKVRHLEAAWKGLVSAASECEQMDFRLNAKAKDESAAPEMTEWYRALEQDVLPPARNAIVLFRGILRRIKYHECQDRAITPEIIEETGQKVETMLSAATEWLEWTPHSHESPATASS